MVGEIIRAWHFTSNTLRDGSPIPQIGEWLIHDGPAKMCQSGLHASKHVMNALKYAPGNILHFVECRDIVQEHDDKLVCRRRRIVESHDCEELLRKFACDRALSVVPENAPDAIVNYLRNPKEEHRVAACDAAWAAEAAAVRNSAWSAAMAADAEATPAAACSAAWAAEYAAVRASARAVAWATTREAEYAAARSSAWAAEAVALRAAAKSALASKSDWSAKYATAREAAAISASAAAMADLQRRVNKKFLSVQE